jgi:hypothetical protein
MFNGSMPSEQASAFKPIGTSGHSDQESRTSKEPTYLGLFRKQRVEMEDKAGSDSNIEGVIVSSTRQLIAAIAIAATVIGVPLWFYEKNSDALLEVKEELASDIKELKKDLSKDINELKKDMTMDVSEVKTNIKAVESKVIDNGYAIGRIETNIKRLLEDQEK